MDVADQIWFDGSFVDQRQATVPLLSHSLHYGSTIFEGMRFYDTVNGPAVFRLKEHIERFIHSANSIQFPLIYTEEQLFEAVLATIRQNKIPNGYIRVVGYFGAGDMELHPTKATRHVAIMLWPWDPRFGTQSISLTIPSLWRTPPQCTVISAKIAGHYANSILARQEARRKGFYESLLLDYEGNIAEASGANFFAIKKGVLYTPPEANIFAGITRDSILQIAKHLHISTRITTINPSHLSQFDEAFLSGTAVEVVPIINIDQARFQYSYGPLTRKLKDFYTEVTHGKHPEFSHWLQPAAPTPEVVHPHQKI